VGVETKLIVETGAAALLFALAFLVGGRVHPLRPFVRDRRTLVSFGAGMSAAYVMVHVLPELHGARHAFTESSPVVLRFEGMAVYYLVLVGFLAFYGLDHWRAFLRASSEPEQEMRAYKLQAGGFAAYVFLMAYLLVNRLEESETSILLYAAAIACHFLAIDHELRREHGETYGRTGRWVLAGAAASGWLSGLLVHLPTYVAALMMAFVSGAIIINSSIMELPSEKDGRFLPFMTGGLLYGLVLLPLG
jgi:hypothetical protein